MSDPISNVRAVLFDAGGTLVHVRPSVGAVYSDTASRYGVEISKERLDPAFRSAWKRLRPQHGHASPFRTSEADERAWWRKLVETIFADVGARDAFADRFDPFFDELYEVFALPDVWNVFDDVVPTLDALNRAGIRCAVVSNWDSRLPRLLTALALAEQFEFVLTSAETGFSKPHPAIFEAAVSRLELPAQQVVNIGDSFVEDVEGAEAAGLRGVHLTRDGGDGIATLTALVDRIA
jgi:putative hydrolase of the HAD superfamily